MPIGIPGAQPMRVIRQERFALAVAQGLTLVEASVAAGYSPKGGAPYMRSKKPHVAARIEYLRKRTAEKTVNAASVSRSEIIESVRARRARAAEGTPLVARDGTPTGESREDYAAGNRCDEILAKMHGFLLDVHTEEDLSEALKDKNIDELREQLASDIHDLDPNLHKQVVEETEADCDETAPNGHSLQ